MVNPAEFNESVGFTYFFCSENTNKNVTSAMKSLFTRQQSGMEKIIHYIWKNRLFPLSELRTTSGEKLRVIDNGHNNDGGNIFSDARIRIGDKTWVGNVILHSKSSEWEREIITDKRNTDNIILHVTMENDCSMLRKHGEEVQQLCLSYPPNLKNEIYSTMEKKGDNKPAE